MPMHINKAAVLRMGVGEEEMKSPSFPRPVLVGEELLWFISEVVAYLAVPRGSRHKHWSTR